MLNLLYEGQVALFLLILISIVISLSFHEFGHAFVAKCYGDDTAERAGRLTLNPIAHIDPMGLLMVMAIGFGYARPVPTNPRNFTSRFADLMVSAAGPAMNLILAIICVNLFVLSAKMGWTALQQPGPAYFLQFMAQINLLLMIFNLIPLGPLDGHYILPYFLPRKLASLYRYYNDRYGTMVLLSLILLSFLGISIFQKVLSLSSTLIPYLVFV